MIKSKPLATFGTVQTVLTEQRSISVGQVKRMSLQTAGLTLTPAASAGRQIAASPMPRSYPTRLQAADRVLARSP
jgi:hypothetical protein